MQSDGPLYAPLLLPISSQSHLCLKFGLGIYEVLLIVLKGNQEFGTVSSAEVKTDELELLD